MKITDTELESIYGGAFSATMLNAIIRGVEIIFEIGKSIGSSIRRVKTKNYC